MSAFKGELKGVSKLAPKATPAGGASVSAGEGKSLSGDFNSEASVGVLEQLKQANSDIKVNASAQLWIQARNNDGPLYVPAGSSVILPTQEKIQLKTSTTADVQHTMAVLKTVAGSASLHGTKINASYIFQKSAAKRLMGAVKCSCELILEVMASKIRDGAELTKEEILSMNQASAVNALTADDLKTAGVCEAIKDHAVVRHAVQVSNLANAALLEYMKRNFAEPKARTIADGFTKAACLLDFDFEGGLEAQYGTNATALRAWQALKTPEGSQTFWFEDKKKQALTNFYFDYGSLSQTYTVSEELNRFEAVYAEYEEANSRLKGQPGFEEYTTLDKFWTFLTTLPLRNNVQPCTNYQMIGSDMSRVANDAIRVIADRTGALYSTEQRLALLIQDIQAVCSGKDFRKDKQTGASGGGGIGAGTGGGSGGGGIKHASAARGEILAAMAGDWRGICKAHLRTGKCANGKKCRLVHLTDTEFKDHPLCRSQSISKCRFSKLCKFRHVDDRGGNGNSAAGAHFTEELDDDHDEGKWGKRADDGN
jgi:hypothetical protein